jgi:nucleotide-binding universal stress UspA family protein
MPAPAAVVSATDLSASARHAADRAARVARRIGAELTLVHALPVAMLDDLQQWLGGEQAKQLESEAGSRLDELASELRSARQSSVHARLVQGPLLEELESVADALDACLVVVGMHGAGFLHRLAMGTTAERVLRRVRRPVLAVRTLPHEP